MINWKIRFMNPTFIAHLAVSIFTPILVHMGYNWNDMTTWGMISDMLTAAIQNPVVVVAVLVSVYNCFIDPTTKGLADSEYALHKTSLEVVDNAKTDSAD